MVRSADTSPPTGVPCCRLMEGRRLRHDAGHRPEPAPAEIEPPG